MDSSTVCRPDSVRFGLVGRTCGRGIGGPGGASALSDLSLPRRVCVVSNYALARPWFTFLMCPIELDPVQLVMAVYPFKAVPERVCNRTKGKIELATAGAKHAPGQKTVF